MTPRKLRCAEISSDPLHRGYAPAELEELVESIHVFGVLRPVLVRPSGAGFTIVHGERRLQAAKIAGLEHVPAVIVQEAGNDSGALIAA